MTRMKDTYAVIEIRFKQLSCKTVWASLAESNAVITLKNRLVLFDSSSTLLNYLDCFNENYLNKPYSSLIKSVIDLSRADTFILDCNDLLNILDNFRNNFTIDPLGKCLDYINLLTDIAYSLNSSIKTVSLDCLNEFADKLTFFDSKIDNLKNYSAENIINSVQEILHHMFSHSIYITEKPEV